MTGRCAGHVAALLRHEGREAAAEALIAQHGVAPVGASDAPVVAAAAGLAAAVQPQQQQQQQQQQRRPLEALEA